MENPQTATGIVYLIPVGLSEENPGNHLPSMNASIISDLDEFVVENIRTARRFLRSIGYLKNFAEVCFHVLDKHTVDTQIPGFLANVVQGKNIGLLSEAGNPCIADPGNKVVKLAHEKNLRVVPLVGPCSILMALISSGFNGQSFAFSGYLPVDRKARQQRIKELQQIAIQKDQTQIFMETPYRNNALLNDLLLYLSDNTLLCIAANITCANERIITRTVKQWKKQTPDLQKQPSVFLISHE
jgi:16S rRNA (cytidine1402-2'-O)-methyltransferase